jgi:hypothetical protein
VRPNRLRTGVIFIGLGIALLLFNMDRLDGWYFADLVRLWPVLLVAIGIEIVSRQSKAPSLGYLSPVLIAGAFIYAGYAGQSGLKGDWHIFSWSDDEPSLRTTDHTFEADGPVDEARYYIDIYNGSLRIEGGAEGLGSGSFHSAGKVRTSISESDGRAVVRVRQSGASRHEDADFSVSLAEGLPLTLDLKAEDARIDVDAAALALQLLYLEISTGGADITFGRASDSVWASLSPGAAQLQLRLPREAGLRLEGMRPSDETDYGDFELISVDSRLETADFEGAEIRFIFKLEEPASKLTLEAY